VHEPVRNAFTIDVEDYFHVAALAPAIPRARWSEMEYRCESNVARLLAMLEERGVRGTFFILGWVAERSPQLVRDIARAGHEVACHGWSHELIYKQSPDVFRAETRRSKLLLEDLIGARVDGYRAASFSIVKSSLWAIDVLIDLGFTYDSSVFPVRHDRYGIPDAPRAPYLIESPSGGTLLEFPMSVASMAGMTLPVSGGGYFRIFPYWLNKAGLSQINRAGRPFVFYLHPWEIDTGQPRVNAGMLSTFRHYTNLGRCERRLRQLLADFRFGSMRDVLAATPPEQALQAA
jgi:polysaccharide deacetylase family protein (PEP-CTERM system associated)